MIFRVTCNSLKEAEGLSKRLPDGTKLRGSVSGVTFVLDGEAHIAAQLYTWGETHDAIVAHVIDEKSV
jgi:hypothetical protein